MIEFRNIKKSFGERVILDGVSLSARDGEVLFIVGTSGVGKSVLIKQVVGFLRPDSGAIFVDGKDVTALSEREFFAVRKQCALVFQQPTLFDSMSCLKNVALPLIKHRAAQGGARDALDRASELLARVGMEDYCDAFPHELGEGLRKRIAIARALGLGPRYLLLDEPTTGLDPASARQVDTLVRQLAVESGVTCVVVSHDLTSIFGIADRVAMLYKGIVWTQGTPDQLRSNPDPAVQQFTSGAPDGPLETT